MKIRRQFLLVFLLLFGSIMAFWMRPDEGLDDPAPTIGHTRAVPEAAV